MEETTQILTELHKVVPGRVNDAVALMRCCSNRQAHMTLGPRAASSNTDGGTELLAFQRQKAET